MPPRFADRDEVLAFVAALAGEGGSTVAADTPLVRSGLIDSFGVLEIVAFLEGRFGVRIEPGAVTEANFATVDSIVALLRRAGASSGRAVPSREVRRAR